MCAKKAVAINPLCSICSMFSSSLADGMIFISVHIRLQNNNWKTEHVYDGGDGLGQGSARAGIGYGV